MCIPTEDNISKTSSSFKFKAILRGVYTGQIGLHDEKLKKEIDSLRADYPEALKAMKSLPADPHACLNILKLW